MHLIPRRWLGAGLLAATAVLAAWVPGCTTGAVGVEECREIELLRCEYSVSCGVIEASELDSCKRFYRAQCLHGIEGDTAPTANQQKRCVAAIRDAGKCAQEESKMEVTQCSALVTDTSGIERLSGSESFEDVCDLVSRPWDLKVCNYLNQDTDGEGGSSG